MKEVVTEKLNEKDLTELSRVELILGSTEKLGLYNEAPYFSIKKFYNEGIFCGFAVIFLGYNGLTSSDASLEEIVYWIESSDLLCEFLRTINDHKDFPINIERICFDTEKFADIAGILENSGFEAIRNRI